MNTIILKVLPEHDGQRVDKLISLCEDSLTRTAVQRLAESGNIYVDGKEVKSNYKVKAEQTITVEVPEPVEYVAQAEDIPLDIIYEDSDLLVVNKPKGMVVHPAAGNYTGTLVNALLFHCKDSLSGINGVIRPGIVHRIDKDTSGLLIVAKNDTAHVHLAEQIKQHSFTREYEAIVAGNLKQDEGTVNAPIGRHHTERKKMTVTDKNSKHAVTHYEVLQRFGTYTHVRLRLETGRTHQIRVHMSYIGHPVAGDEVYGNRKSKDELGLKGQCLHARKIGFIHPKTGEYLQFNSDLPDYFAKALVKLKINAR